MASSEISSPWIRVRILGRGSYGVVHLAVYKEPNEDGTRRRIAVKSARLADASSLIKENRIYHVFRDCPGIARCFSDEITPGPPGLRLYSLLLEYAPGGTLGDLIRRERGGGGIGLFETDVRNYTRMILKALRCMHAKGYVHCDLKPSNILAFPRRGDGDGDASASTYELKLADFGLVKEPQEELRREEWVGKFRGTPDYMAPESVALGIICPRLDVWSLGCVVVQMMTGEATPWAGAHERLGVGEFRERLVFGGLGMKPRVPPFMSELGKDFLSKCFQRDPRKRCSSELLMRHPYVDERFKDVALLCRSSDQADHPRSLLRPVYRVVDGR